MYINVLFEMKSEHSWTNFICETCIKLNKLSYQIMQKKLNYFLNQ
jgi:hypothetical protein